MTDWSKVSDEELLAEFKRRQDAKGCLSARGSGPIVNGFRLHGSYVLLHTGGPSPL